MSNGFEWTDSCDVRHSYSYRMLIKNVFRNLKTKKPKQRWAVVVDTFAIGSQGAYALCKEFGFNPDEVIK